ncbi:MAG: hypothetical protein PHX83_15105 [Acidobacteriia bacterium]|nr:hypothetical protein [Terriglobia bacterium]
MHRTHSVFWKVFLIGGLLAGGISSSFAKDKVDPSEIVSRNLQSIGTAAALSARKNMDLEGEAQLHMITGGQAALQGQARLISDGQKLRFQFIAHNPNYDIDEYAFDGKSTTIGFISPGHRSRLGQFLFTYRDPVTLGLLGGELTTAWPLLQPDLDGAKLSYDGIKKIDGKPYHELRYRPKKGERDLNVFFYFDPETYHHVYSVYRVTVPATIGMTIDQSSQQRESRFAIEEKFDDFRTVDGLTLPSKWQLRVTVDKGDDSSITVWDMSFTRAMTNQVFPPDAFVISNGTTAK